MEFLETVRRDALSFLAGWVNPVTGQGDPTRDKQANMIWSAGAPLDDELLEMLFAWNDLAYVICTALPEWGLRHGWDLALTTQPKGEGDATAALDAQEVESAIRSALDELAAHGAQLRAGAWGQTFGGGLLLIGANDGQETKLPLNLDKLQSVDWIRDVPASQCHIDTIYSDPGKPKHGEPAHYKVNELFATKEGLSSSVFHESRVIRYPGAVTPPKLKQMNSGWDLSVLDRVIARLQLHDGLWANAGAMMQDGSQGVWKIKGLVNAIMGGSKSKVEDRFELADKARGLFRSILLDADGEDFQYVHRNFSGIDGLLAQSAVRTAAAAQMPVTVLYGQSPAGLNSTGESDIRLWYDRVEAYQEDVLRPGLERLVRLIFRSKNGPTKGQEPRGWRMNFRPVRKATPMEEAELRARQAQIDTANVTAGIAGPEEIAVSRFTAEGWSPETQIDLEARRTILKQTKGMRAGPARAPDAFGLQAAANLVAQVQAGAISREAGLELLMLAFPTVVDRAKAEALLPLLAVPPTPAPTPTPTPPPTPPAGGA